MELRRPGMKQQIAVFSLADTRILPPKSSNFILLSNSRFTGFVGRCLRRNGFHLPSTNISQIQTELAHYCAESARVLTF